VDKKEFEIRKLKNKLEEEGIDFEEVMDKITNERKREQTKIQRIEKLTRDFNDLERNMQDILAENAVLRQLAKVPENFGAMVNDIKIEREGNTKIRF